MNYNKLCDELQLNNARHYKEHCKLPAQSLTSMCPFYERDPAQAGHTKAHKGERRAEAKD